MTPKKIEAAKARESIVFDTAKRIREALDEARQTYGASEWDDGDCESRVLELVTEDDQ